MHPADLSEVKVSDIFVNENENKNENYLLNENRIRPKIDFWR
jgi:hypothetical protein